MKGITTADPTLLWVTTIGLATVGLVLVYLFSTTGKTKKKKTFLPIDDFVAIPLIRKDSISHDVVKFTFALPAPDHILGLPIGQHLSLKFVHPVTGQAVQRSYTPVSYAHTTGEVSFVIKVYRPCPPKFPTGGQMSQHLDSLAIGDTILVYGPKGHVDWHGQGVFHTKPLGKPKELRKAHNFCLIAGGTGITPMLQILHAIFVDDAATTDTVSVKLLYANQTENDILVRDELEALQAQYPTRLTIWYTVDQVVSNNANDWKYDTGFINKRMIEQHGCFPTPTTTNTKNANTQFFMCGPPPMIKFACIPALTELGYTEKDWVIF